ncbi:MAG: gamma-glutamyl-gamma-aminobutyrate hydrolase family protein [candidate division WOR-3 bacterium]
MSAYCEKLILVTGPSLVKPSYCNYLYWIGPDSRLITPASSIPHSFSGLVLSGGGDVHPDLYRGDPSACELVDPNRDELEFRLLEIATKRRVPILGICRGIQVLNVFFGGTLIGNIEGHSALDAGDQKIDRRHRIKIVEGTRLHAILGEGTTEVNSAHHQAIDSLGDGLVVSATAEDGTIEAVELPGEPFTLAVQWHPERDRNESYNPSSLAIREAFMREVSLFDRQ